MRVPVRRSQSALGFNITPLIDVVFLLIIFFLVASHIARTQAQEAVDLPDAVKVDEDTAAPNLLTVTLQADGQMTLNGNIVTFDQLTLQLEGLLDSESGPPEVRVRGDRTTAFLHVEPILLKCAELGIRNVKFAVRKVAE